MSLPGNALLYFFPFLTADKTVMIASIPAAILDKETTLRTEAHSTHDVHTDK